MVNSYTDIDMNFEAETRFVDAKRLDNSPSGNPHWRVLVTLGVYETQMDARCNYEIERIQPNQAIKISVENGRIVDITNENGGSL